MCEAVLLYSPFTNLFGSINESDLLRCLDEMPRDGKKYSISFKSTIFFCQSFHHPQNESFQVPATVRKYTEC